MATDTAPVIYWIRRDLRISDNQPLMAASRSETPVIPVYFLSNWKGQHAWTGQKRQQFLCDCLVSMARNLESIGGRLVIRHESVVEGLRMMIQETGATALHYQADPDPYGKQTETKVQKLCRELNIECHRHFEVAMHHPDEVLTQTGQPYRVYTPYSRTWLELDKAAPVGKPK